MMTNETHLAGRAPSNGCQHQACVTSSTVHQLPTGSAANSCQQLPTGSAGLALVLVAPGHLTRLSFCAQLYTCACATSQPARPLCLCALQELGHEALCWGPTTAVPCLLGEAPAVWQAALAVWDIIGVPDPEALALHNSHLVTVSWLNPDRLSIVLALQRKLPGQLSAAEVIVACAPYSMFSTERIIGRLLFLEQQGVLDRFVRIKAGEPDSRQLISLADVANHKDRSFAALVARLRARPSQQV